MKKGKYRIVNSDEYSMNQAYEEGYEFVAILQEHYESSHSNGYNGITNNETSINISIPQHTGSTSNRILMQLKATAEVLYGK